MVTHVVQFEITSINEADPESTHAQKSTTSRIVAGHDHVAISSNCTTVSVLGEN